MARAVDAALQELTACIPEVLRAAERDSGGGSLLHARPEYAHSNDIAELTFTDGRVLVLKRARHGWVSACFATAQAAARVLDAETDLVVPRPLPMQRAGRADLQVYWRIQLPTLAQLWPALDGGGRAASLRSLGRMLRRMHGAPASGFGPLHLAAPAATLAEELDRDLRQRLLPAVYAHWDAGAYFVEQLIALIPRVERIHGGRAPVLVHNDLHTGNVLCTTRRARVECVGLLDLDGFTRSAPERDLAGFDVLHGRLFCQGIAPELRAELARGYDGDTDASLLAYFRCVHLVNQGFTSGLLGHAEHAASIEDELTRLMPLLHRIIPLHGEPPLH